MGCHTLCPPLTTLKWEAGSQAKSGGRTGPWEPDEMLLAKGELLWGGFQQDPQLLTEIVSLVQCSLRIYLCPQVSVKGSPQRKYFLVWQWPSRKWDNKIAWNTAIRCKLCHRAKPPAKVICLQHLPEQSGANAKSTGKRALLTIGMNFYHWACAGHIKVPPGNRGKQGLHSFLVQDVPEFRNTEGWPQNAQEWGHRG